MKKLFLISVFVSLFFFLYTQTLAEVPQMMNYQGKLATNTGAPVNDTLQMVFTIYADEAGTTPLWTETQSAVEILKGVFNVILGSVNPISFSVFDGSTRYLGVKVGADPEITPRKPMVSVAYAYKSFEADTANYARGGGAINCHACDTVFVNVIGPDSVVATSGTAFLGKASGGNASAMHGVEGYGDNTSTGDAYGGYFSTSSSGTGTHYGIAGEGHGSSSYTYGVKGYADNTSGTAIGGDFSTTSSGAGDHYGVIGQAYGASSALTFGFYGSAYSTSTGEAYGGWFWAQGVGEGWMHAGVEGRADGSTNYNCGVRGYASSDGGARLNGGYFQTSSTGTGEHMAVEARGHGSSSAEVSGIWGWASNEGTGPVYGGYFFAHPAGTGEKYGVYASAPTDQGYAGYFQGDVRITDSLVVAGTAQMTGFKMPTGASNGYVLTSDASGVGTWQVAAGGDNDWIIDASDGDTTLFTGGAWGIARYGNVLYGDADSTHVNLGVACTTGTSGQNYKYCTVGGGVRNTASGQATTVGGGVNDTASGNSATVGGGSGNAARNSYATVGGGQGNTASGGSASVGGGHYNAASGSYATVGGGYVNTASGASATVGGGQDNTASGGSASVGGGYDNAASGSLATVPGGYADTAGGDYSFAVGDRVRITSAGDYTFAFGSNFSTSASHAVIFHDTQTPIKVGIGTTSPQRALHISDVMRLEPRASAPASPSEGDIYVNSTDHHIYCYLNGVWKQLD
jgi:hypothetical protein